MKNNNNNHNEKKNLGIIVFGLLPNYIVKKKKFVLQYSFCITERKRIEGCLYCNTIFCIVIEACVD